jgi:hypothetical protein
LRKKSTVANKIIGDSTSLLEGRVSRVYRRGHFALHSFVVLILLLSTLSLGTTALLVYQQSVQAAFRSVSDALVAHRKSRKFRVQEEFLFQSAQDAARLSHMRYSGGVTGYLEVLTNETNAFSSELAVVQARQNELLALVQLYEALGGGWQR